MGWEIKSSVFCCFCFCFFLQLYLNISIQCNTFLFFATAQTYRYPALIHVEFGINVTGNDKFLFCFCSLLNFIIKLNHLVGGLYFSIYFVDVCCLHQHTKWLKKKIRVELYMKSKHKEERTNFSERIRRKENSFWVPFSFIFIVYDSKI